MGYWVFNRFYYAPNNVKLQNAPPPGANPGHLTVHFAWEGGILTLPWKGGEFEPDLSLFSFFS